MTTINDLPNLPAGLVYRDGKIFCAKDNAKMVFIPAGDLVMYSSRGNPAQQVVHIEAFYMDIYPVTNAPYRQFVNDTGRREPKGKSFYNGTWVEHFEPWRYSEFNGDTQPVVCVSWYDAVAYCQWAGKLLPTEAEWEWAAQGGEAEHRYPFKDGPSKSMANYGACDGYMGRRGKFIVPKGVVGHTTPVGSYPPNHFGLYDIAGNVAEWCFNELHSGIYKRPENPESEIEQMMNRVYQQLGELRVLRGGSWYDEYEDLEATRRGGNSPDRGSNTYGFRCVVPAEKSMG